MPRSKIVLSLTYVTVTYFATGDGSGLVTFELIEDSRNIQQNLHCNCRAKMAASFKLPCLVKKRKPPVNFPRFEWRDISMKEQLGSGTFGSVYLVNYEKEEQNVIVKKMKGELAEAKRRFEKEAAILNTVKGHRNVCEFLKF